MASAGGFGTIPRKLGRPPVHAEEKRFAVICQIQIIGQREGIGNRIGPVTVHVQAKIIKAGHQIVDDRIIADQRKFAGDATGSLACVAVLVDYANFESDSGLVDDLGDIPLYANLFVDLSRIKFCYRSNMINRAAGFMWVDPITHLAARPPIIAADVVPVAENAIVVIVVAVVIGVKLYILGIADFGGQLDRVAGADIQHTAVGGGNGRRAGIVGSNLQKLAGRWNDITGAAGNQRMPGVIVDAHGHVVDVVAAALPPEQKGVGAGDQFAQRHFLHPGRAAPVIAAWRLVDFRRIVIEAKARTARVVIAPQIDEDLGLQRPGDAIWYIQSHRLRAFSQRVRFGIPDVAVRFAIHTRLDAAAGELSMAHPVLFVRHLTIGIIDPSVYLGSPS